MDGGALCWGRITGWKKRNHTVYVSEEAETHIILCELEGRERFTQSVLVYSVSQNTL